MYFDCSFWIYRTSLILGDACLRRHTVDASINKLLKNILGFWHYSFTLVGVSFPLMMVRELTAMAFIISVIFAISSVPISSLGLW